MTWLALALIAVANPRFLLFGDKGPDWLLLEANSRKIERFTTPVGQIEGIAVAPDGQSFAYIARVSAERLGIWSWKRGQAPPLLLESKPGRYSDPAFSPDGWIYFSRSPSDGTRQHTFGTYAQVFRVRPDGSELQQVTDENGCHFASAFTPRGELVYVHSSCSVRTWIERRHDAPKPEILVTVVGSIAEATTSPNSDAVLFVQDEPDSFAVQEVRSGQKPHVLFRLDRSMERVRAAYGRTSKEIFYQQGGQVWVLSKGVRSAIAPLEERGVQ